MTTPTHEESRPRQDAALSKSLDGDSPSLRRDHAARQEGRAPVFGPYPPFNDVDWRPAVGLPSGSVQQRANNLVDEATAHHGQRHEHHDHPWCLTCFVRGRLEYMEFPPRSPAEIDAWVRVNGHDKMLVYAAEAALLHKDGFLGGCESFRTKYGTVLSESLCDALSEYVTLHDEWEYESKTAWRVTNNRATRWLSIHGRPPEDPWPSVPTPTDTEGEFLTRAELRDLPTVQPLIENRIPRHSYGILSGRDGSFKTFVALDWGCCLATGLPWQGRSSERVKVLYIAAEGAYGIDKRLDAWESANGTKIDDNHFVVRPSGLNMFRTTSDFDRLIEHIDEHGYGLIIVDTLRRVAGGADGNGTDMGVVVDHLARLKDHTIDGTVLVIAHTGKDDRDTRGFSGIEDDADFVWHVKRDGQSVELTNTKMKDGPDGARIQLTARSELDSLVLSASSAGNEVMVASEAQIRLLDTIQNVFPDGVSGPQLLNETGLSKTNFYGVLKTLVDRGLVVKSGTAQRPFYTPVSQDRFPSDSHGTVPPGPSPIPTPISEIPLESQPDSQPESGVSQPPLGLGHRDGTQEES